jgi:hypothetical protein
MVRLLSSELLVLERPIKTEQSLRNHATGSRALAKAIPFQDWKHHLILAPRDWHFPCSHSVLHFCFHRLPRSMRQDEARKEQLSKGVSGVSSR